MAQKQYLSYPVTEEWCDRVRDALRGMKRGALTRLAEKCRVSTGHLTDVLNGKYQTSPLVEPIHDFFGWEPPLPPTAALDAGELVHGYRRMRPAQREFLDDAREQLEGLHGDQARKALEEFLKAFRARAND